VLMWLLSIDLSANLDIRFPNILSPIEFVAIC
jgi:hypothetical protein